MNTEEELNKLSNDFPDLLIKSSDFSINRRDLLGNGEYSTVRSGLFHRLNKKCAIKEIYEDEDEEADLSTKSFISEVRALAKCRDNPFILKIYGFVTNLPYVIVTDLYKNGTLDNYLYQIDDEYDEDDIFLNDIELMEKQSNESKLLAPKTSLTATEKTFIALALAYSLDSIHSQNIIHLDLKTSNILLDDEKNPVLCDFGNAIIQDSDKKHVVAVTFNYLPPELTHKGDFDFKADVYSYGVILWEMYTQQIPYMDEPFGKIILSINEGKRLPLPEDMPKSMKDLIIKCWKEDSKERPTMKEIFDMFKESHVQFPGTDANQLAQRIQKYDL